VANPDYLPSDFPARIKRLRGRLGLTQGQLAERLGVSFATVNRWENRQSRPSRLAWEQIERLSSGSHEASTAPVAQAPPSHVDFASNAEVVRAIAEGERLSFGHLANPAFATEVSRIDPLPHQRIAVYEHMLKQKRLRFLLADDAGAGKTIMAGLYIREMFSRRLLRRVLIVTPAGLVGNWKRELERLFALPFRIVERSDHYQHRYTGEFPRVRPLEGSLRLAV